MTTSGSTAKYRRAVVAAASASITLSIFASSHAYQVGDQVKPLVLNGVSGEIRIPAAQKRWQYVDFWASWCAPCKLSFPWMNRVREGFAKRGVDIVAVNVDAKRSDADRFLKQIDALSISNPLTIALAFDAIGVSPKAFAVQSMPSAYLIDPDGRVRWIHRGFREGDSAKIEAEINKIVSTP